MKPASSSHMDIEGESLRRSNRERTPLKHDYLAISTGRYQELGIADIGDDDYEPKSNRRRLHKDSDQYENTPKKFRKLNPNRISHLLEWKKAGHYDQDNQQIKPNFVHKVKSISNVELSKFGKDIEGLFINVKWRSKQNPRGINVTELKQVNLQDKALMSCGMVFIWSEKEIMADIMRTMESKGFNYVENFQIIYISLEKCNGEMNKVCVRQQSKGHGKLESKSNSTVSNLDDMKMKDEFLDSMDKVGTNLDGSKMILEQDSSFFKRSKRTLLMFRKESNTALELRHQRTCDVLFDLVSENNLECDPRSKGYVYKIIQTLLPKALEVDKKASKLRLMELWADTPRKSWISIMTK